VLSHAVNLHFGDASEKGIDFGKTVLYYLLLITIINTSGRLQSFLTWIVAFTAILTVVALLQYHEYIDLPALEMAERYEEDEEGELIPVYQLYSTGIFNDPNDLSMILVIGMIISLYRVADRHAGLFRVFWVLPVVLFTYAILMTRSRGGFLALLASLMTLFVTRFGWRRSIPLILIALSAMLVLSGGRQAKISTGEETAQERMKLWSEGLSMMKQSPRWALTGIGAGQYAEELPQVAHNSFVHAFVELGFLGGALFLGAFYVAARSLHQLGARSGEALDPALRGMRPFLMAIVIGYSMGMISLSRCYVVPTYVVLGLVSAYFQVAVCAPTDAIPRMDGRLVRRFAIIGVGFLIFIQLFIRANVHYN